MVDQLITYYTPAAIERLEINFQNEIKQLKNNNEKKKQNILTNIKNGFNKEFENDDKALINTFKQHLKENSEIIDIAINKKLEEYDIKTKNLVTDILTDEELISDINPDNCQNIDDYDKKTRDIIRNYRGNLRKQAQERRIYRRQLIKDLDIKKKDKKENLKKELDIERNNLLKTRQITRIEQKQTKLDKLSLVWDDILNKEIFSFTNNWNNTKEEKIKIIIETFIDENKSRIINNDSNQLHQNVVLNMKETFNKRLDSDWVIEKQRKIKYKLCYLDDSIKSFKIAISIKWDKKKDKIISELNNKLNEELIEIDTISKLYSTNSLKTYKESIIVTLKEQKLELNREDFETDSEYNRQLRDEERQIKNYLRQKQKELRHITKIPPEFELQMQKQIQMYEDGKQIIRDKYTELKSETIKEITNKKNNETDLEVKILIEKETLKVEQEIDLFEKAWKLKKKEECLLLNKVQDNNDLEVELLNLDSKNITQKKTIDELRAKTQELTLENTKLKETIKSLNINIDNYQKDKEFIDRLKKKMIKPEINKNEEQKEVFSEIVNSARTINANIVNTTPQPDNRIVIPTISDEIIDKNTMEKKLLMKMILREKGPIYDHTYTCNGIYRDGSDFDMVLKSASVLIIDMKFDASSQLLYIKTDLQETTIQLILEKDLYFEFKISIIDMLISLTINSHNFGTYELRNHIFENITVRIKSIKSIFYNQYITINN